MATVNAVTNVRDYVTVTFIGKGGGWAIGSLRRRSPEGRRRGLQAGAIASALGVVGLALSRLIRRG